MKPILSFSLFDCKHDWQFLFYIRGLVLNVWMTRIVYPEFDIHVHVERSIYIKYKLLLEALGAEIFVREETTLCGMMLWRLSSLFIDNVKYVFPRDTDSLVTTREAFNVQKFIESGRIIQGIHDNPAHSIPLMGGMSGFMVSPLRYQYQSFYIMLSKATRPINQHGSDQHFLNDVVYNDFKHSYFSEPLITAKDGSDLCVSFVGAAGCNEFETLRYLRSKGIDLSLGGVGEKFSKIFYWL